MKDYIVKAITKDGTVRICCATTREMVNEAQKTHKLMPVAAAALGRTLTAAALMGSMLKGEKESVSIQIKGDGPLGKIIAISDSKCNVKGQVDNGLADLPLNYAGKLDVGAAIGEGTLVVIRDLEMKEPYIGQVPLTTSEIGDDLTYYYMKSEQTPSSVGLGVLVDVDYSIKAAGGFILQLLPDADEDTVAKLENALKSVKSVTEMLDGGKTPEDIIEKLLEGFEIDFLGRVECAYKCDCSRDRMARALISIGEKELTDMIEEDGQAEIMCHFCLSKYMFTKEQLEELKNKIKEKQKYKEK